MRCQNGYTESATATSVMNSPKIGEILKQIKPIVQQLEKIAFLIPPHLTAYHKGNLRHRRTPVVLAHGNTQTCDGRS